MSDKSLFCARGTVSVSPAQCGPSFAKLAAGQERDQQNERETREKKIVSFSSRNTEQKFPSVFEAWIVPLFLAHKLGEKKRKVLYLFLSLSFFEEENSPRQ